MARRSLSGRCESSSRTKRKPTLTSVGFSAHLGSVRNLKAGEPMGYTASTWYLLAYLLVIAFVLALVVFS
jgi:hypothetical protein